MLTMLPWLSIFLLADHTLLRRTASPAIRELVPVYAVADTAIEGAPLVLTMALVTPYLAVSDALQDYWDEHRDEYKAAKARGLRIDEITRRASTWEPNYPVLVHQNTAVAAIFQKFHADPAQFAPTMTAVRTAIGTILQGQSVDSMTVLSKNVAFVKAHQKELSSEWQTMNLVMLAIEKMSPSNSLNP